MANGTAKSWERAHKLVRLADSGTVTGARSFISWNKELVPLLNGKCDKRNPRVRDMVKDFKKWSKKHGN